ncbi:MAG: prepilin-type N-terminal cleavage/methylation domain-containing protein [Lentisphaeria bacterium]
MKAQTHSFTLIELMIVAIIVAILAAVAVSLMRGNTIRAMATEAEASMGMIRTALRANYAETSKYDTLPGGTAIATDCSNLPGVKFGTAADPKDGDLDGRYWKERDFSLALTPSTYTITAKGNGTDVPTTVKITLDDNGVFTRTGL